MNSTDGPPRRLRLRIDGLHPALRPADVASLVGIDLDSVRPRDAAALAHALNGLLLSGRTLSVVVLDPPGFRIPPVPRHRRDRSARDRPPPWLPFLDEEGRYSLSAQADARRHAACFVEAGVDLVIDAFAGCGGDTIALAEAGLRVIAVERSTDRLALARRNAVARGVSSQIRFLEGDAARIVPRLLADHPNAGLFLDPPWGGPGAASRLLVAPDLGLDRLATSLFIAQTVVLKLPRSLDPDSLPGGPWSVGLSLRPVRDGDPPVVAGLVVVGGAARSHA